MFKTIWKNKSIANQFLISRQVSCFFQKGLSKFNFGSANNEDHEEPGLLFPHEEILEDVEYNDEKPLYPEDTTKEEALARIFKTRESFSVDSMLESVNTPLTQTKEKHKAELDAIYKSEETYLEFLASVFEKKTLEKYPDYKKDLKEYRHLIPNWENLNPYQREVFTLDTYMQWSLEKQELELREKYNFKGTPVERAQQRYDFFKQLTEKNTKDSRIMTQLRNKLKSILEGELKYEEFKNSYNEMVEQKLIDSIIEKRKENFYYNFQENKAEINKELADLRAPGNINRFKSSIQPHDHIHPQHFLKNPEKDNENKWRYLAFFDIIIDQHLRQVRPTSVLFQEEYYKYVKEENKPLTLFEDHALDNMYYDYMFSLDNEFYVKLKQHVAEEFDKIGTVRNETQDPNRPVGKMWKDEHKFPHVADRLGWDFLQEHPLDKNPILERVESHPMYQWQPFVQTPHMDPDKDLSLEEGETVYENKWIFEWVIFWRLCLFLLALPLWVYIYESYKNNSPVSPEYSNRFSLVTPMNMTKRGTLGPIAEKILYWGEDMWMWQHIIRKVLFYPIVIIFAWTSWRTLKYPLSDYVIKAVYNRQKDVLFVWKPTSWFKKDLHVYEMHYLEQTLPNVVSSWANLGRFKKDGLIVVHDLRLNHELTFYNERKYWNVDEREDFFDNTTTYWKGLKHKNVNNGLFINRAPETDPEMLATQKQVTDDLKVAIQKHGPLQSTEYDFNYRYQLRKRIQDLKAGMIEGKETARV